ncbi:MAG: DNA repair and recombination protein RadB [Candidatus Woesearchaeota archaeon]|nr:DNA repair and recombination protein RadB [Candidatus Woesearchaeota archaeon]
MKDPVKDNIKDKHEKSEDKIVNSIGNISKLSTGTGALDILLKGGYESDVITTIYGPAGSGKTNLCLLAMISTIKNGKKAIFIDTEGGFSIERLSQLTPAYKEILDNVLLFKPTNFEEQKKLFEKIRDLANDKIGLIIVDTISMLYRLELGKNEEIPQVNRDLGLQFSYLTEIARKKNIPVLLTTQVYSSFDEREKINLVGGDIVKYGSKCLIELQKYHSNKRAAILRKHRSLPESEPILFEIKQEGIFEVKDKKNN